MADNIGRLFTGAAGIESTRPLLTWYDDTTGDRAELSGVTLDNWVAKTANLLVDAAALAPGDPVGVLLPPHWQSAAVLLGILAAGGRPVHDQPRPVDALFVAADRLGEAESWPAGERYALALAPLAAPLPAVPPGFADYVVEVRSQGDRFGSAAAPPAELVKAATGRAAALGVSTGDRVMIDAARHPDPLDWLFAPLSVGASVVLCAGLDHSRLPARLTTEQVTIALA